MQPNIQLAFNLSNIGPPPLFLLTVQLKINNNNKDLRNYLQVLLVLKKCDDMIELMYDLIFCKSVLSISENFIELN